MLTAFHKFQNSRVAEPTGAQISRRGGRSQGNLFVEKVVDVPIESYLVIRLNDKGKGSEEIFTNAEYIVWIFVHHLNN